MSNNRFEVYQDAGYYLLDEAKEMSYGIVGSISTFIGSSITFFGQIIKRITDMVARLRIIEGIGWGISQFLRWAFILTGTFIGSLIAFIGNGINRMTDISIKAAEHIGETTKGISGSVASVYAPS
jgi:hypothetical protein